tara:strand:- start:1000 stop:2025 length:1026 start_codon:yes stop_codon:yes gene_type:complete
MAIYKKDKNFKNLLNIMNYEGLVKKLGYIDSTLSKSGPSDSLVEIIENYSSNFLEDVSNIYSLIREKEMKDPLTYTSDKTEIPRKFQSLSLENSLDNYLRTKVSDDDVKLYLDETLIARYSSNKKDKIGKAIDIDEETIYGRIHLNGDFFTHIDPPKKIETTSDMRNLAKTFFNVSGKNHVALIQHMEEDSSSNEHYHNFEELIVQLAGISYLEIRNINDDTKRKIVEMGPGDIYNIPAKSLHKVNTLDTGSITIPIKQTNPKKKDHLYQDKSSRRIKEELQDIINMPHNTSKEEVIEELDSYYGALKNSEKKKLTEIISNNSKRGYTHNLLNEFKEQIDS